MSSSVAFRSAKGRSFAERKTTLKLCLRVCSVRGCEAELRGRAFPSGAWERLSWFTLFLRPREEALHGRPVLRQNHARIRAAASRRGILNGPALRGNGVAVFWLCLGDADFDAVLQIGQRAGRQGN